MSLTHQTTDAPYTDREAAYSLELGSRHALSDQIELDAAMEYMRVPDSAETKLSIGVKQRLTATTSIGVNYFNSLENTGIRLIMRFDL